MRRCLLAVFVAAAAFAAPETLVRTTAGPVTGTAGNGIVTYLGLPYAAPPVGELRWCPPQPPTPWTTARACTAFGDCCPQEASDQPFERGRAAEAKQSEDCLTLNLWCPADRAQPRPVMVWIHGGGLVNGGSAKGYYDGTQLARRGVIVVTINYRLGAFGFLTHAGLGAGPQGNWGLLDQIAALRWVRDNIAAFGGNPGCVTIFGESAGALSTCTLLASPAARGLFHRAIAQSGAAPNGVRTVAASQTIWLRKLADAGVRDTSLAALRRLPAADLVKAYHGIGATPGTSGQDMLCLDGTVLTESPAATLAAGRGAAVPLLIGSNGDEGTLFAMRGGPRTKRELEALLNRLSPTAGAEVMRVYPVKTDADAATVYTAALGDASFTATCRRVARWHAAAGQPTWRYWFRETTALSNRLGLGAFHGAEIPFVFGQVDGVQYRQNHRRLAELMNTAWANFAISGAPSAPGLPDWPAYVAARDNAMVLDDQPQVIDGVRTAECDMWDRLSVVR
ncbi:MAG: carboxylesterase/lipase family protein [Armatimonadetes bacterium]|nr:carboxylesterase/lipase family protein [Armatimonadota bacterium]